LPLNLISNICCLQKKDWGLEIKSAHQMKDVFLIKIIWNIDRHEDLFGVRSCTSISMAENRAFGILLFLNPRTLFYRNPLLVFGINSRTMLCVNSKMGIIWRRFLFPPPVFLFHPLDFRFCPWKKWKTSSVNAYRIFNLYYTVITPLLCNQTSVEAYRVYANTHPLASVEAYRTF
jgi:hypothetical protein